MRKLIVFCNFDLFDCMSEFVTVIRAGKKIPTSCHFHMHRIYGRIRGTVKWNRSFLQFVEPSFNSGIIFI